MNVLVVTPTYNERENIEAFVKAVCTALPNADVLIVDDNSPDGTGALAEALATADSHVQVLHRKRKEGLGRAYVDGFRWALTRNYDCIVQMDADFSHDPKELPRLVAMIETCDLVIGSRYCNGIRVLNWPLRRFMLSVGAGVYVRLLTRMPIMDPTGGYKVFKRKVLESIDLSSISSDGYAFQVEINHAAWRAGFHLCEVPIVFADRIAGTSKMSLSIAWEAFIQVLRLAIHRRSNKTVV
ncbi:MAG: polyprenol monophosphomannose synthase [Kiritimatiellia bacterium]